MRISITNCNIEAVLRQFLNSKLLKLLVFHPKTLPDSETIQRPLYKQKNSMTLVPADTATYVYVPKIGHKKAVLNLDVKHQQRNTPLAGLLQIEYDPEIVSHFEPIFRLSITRFMLILNLMESSPCTKCDFVDNHM